MNKITNAKRIKKLLTRALLDNGEMAWGLYEYELEEVLDHMKGSMAHDQDDYIFTVTENTGHVAMVLIEKSGKVHINEQARDKLKTFWPAAYEQNMKRFIPLFALQLTEGELPITGVKAEDS